MELLINQVNWRTQYPEAPQTRVSVRRVATGGNTGEGIELTYSVHGRQLRALALQDMEPVWEDSCVEFFCQVPGESHYMNFEMNCIGTMVAARRLSREDDVELLSAEQMAMIERRCSLPHERIEEKDGWFDWSVGMTIPLSLIFAHSHVPAKGEPIVLNANFYKCGDGTRYPHFVSWQPIALPQPDFHCPQFFGEITL